MSDNNMNFVSFMMISYAMNDPFHDGYAWPTANPRLNCYRDVHCINAKRDTEFLSDIIAQAATFGLHVNLFMNGFWWNHDKVKVSYPNIRAIGPTAGSFYHHCADNDDAWRLACDEISDLLDYYSKSPVSSYGFETIGRGGCTCSDTMRLFNDDLISAKMDLETHPGRRTDPFELWNRLRDGQVLARIVQTIKQVAPCIEIWHHGYMELGDFPGYRFSSDSYRKTGVDVALPCVHSLTSEDMFKRILFSAGDFPVVLHVDTRSKPTLNYDVPTKTPQYIRDIGEWVLKADSPSLRGVVFFNEPPTSRENKDAVYEVVRKWRSAGLFC